jgi:multidrug efflux pump subunit AcrA (membrane-fusion protein)
MSSEVTPPATPPAPALVTRRGLWIAGGSAIAIGVIVVIMGITSRRMADAKLSEWTEDQAVPVVAVATPDTKGKKSTFSLPGRLEGYSQAQIYARVSGYLKSWTADIGASVKAGDLLAEIDAPDLDQQIMQAEAELASAQANSNLSQMTLHWGW